MMSFGTVLKTSLLKSSFERPLDMHVVWEDTSQLAHDHLYANNNYDILYF